MKQALRQSIIAARQKLTEALRSEFSAMITRRILALPTYQQAQTVVGYMSFGAEFSTTAWLQQALRDGKRVLLPRVNSATRQLELYQVHNLQQDLAPGIWNIPEPVPAHCKLVDTLDNLDFILLPGVAFARDGSRLGYGGGFYDKLLARIQQAEGRPALIAPAYSMQIIAEIPQERTDIKVEWLLTENEVIKCNA
jgi:5-formyltetrahydrofolate cyclo-ligase